ncbi:MAG: helix-turn-helix transcriptional regulator [Pseudobdellovibrionaceae bacterium]|nr:helix-turn-helix transcriptional regulator [Pseudobdellovibrionaceae bacterium]
MTNLGLHLKEVRKEKGLSLRDVERRSGYSNSFLSQIESGKRLPGHFALRCIVESMQLDGKKIEPFTSILNELRQPC